MARGNHNVTSRRFRDTAAAVTAGAIILILALPTDALSEYRIKTSGKTVVTKCYWIEGSWFYLFEDDKPIPLSEVSSIEEGSFTLLDQEMNRDAIKRFSVYLSWMIDRDTELMVQDRRNLDALAQIDALKASGQKLSERRSLAKSCLEEVNALRKAVKASQTSWSTVRIPDRSLVLLGEIKSLQMLAWRLSLDERRRYLTTWDPTYRDLALEHMKQTATFEASFAQAMKKVVGE